MTLSEFCKSANERTIEGNEFAPSFIKRIESLESENLEMKKQNTELAELLKKSVRIVKQMDDHTKKCIDNI